MASTDGSETCSHEWVEYNKDNDRCAVCGLYRLREWESQDEYDERKRGVEMPVWIDGRTNVNYHVGDTVILRMADSTYRATVAQVLDYSDDHSDGSACQQYYADVQFPHERVWGGVISQCMIQGFAEPSDVV